MSGPTIFVVDRPPQRHRDDQRFRARRRLRACDGRDIRLAADSANLPPEINLVSSWRKMYPAAPPWSGPSCAQASSAAPDEPGEALRSAFDEVVPRRRLRDTLSRWPPPSRREPWCRLG